VGKQIDMKEVDVMIKQAIAYLLKAKDQPPDYNFYSSKIKAEL
jgi:hypothetical protein